MKHWSTLSSRKQQVSFIDHFVLKHKEEQKYVHAPNIWQLAPSFFINPCSDTVALPTFENFAANPNSYAVFIWSVDDNLELQCNNFWIQTEDNHVVPHLSNSKIVFLINHIGHTDKYVEFFLMKKWSCTSREVKEIPSIYNNLINN